MARIPGINANFDNISGATISRYIGRKYVNHVPSHHPFLMRVFQRGNAQVGTGYQYVLPVRYPSPVGNKVQGISDGYAPIAPPVENGGLSDYTYTPAFFAMNVGLELYDEAAQGPGTTIIDYMQTRMDQSMDTFIEFYQSQLWAAENTVGSGSGSRTQLTSLRTLVNSGGASTTGGAIPAPKTNQLNAATGTSAITLVGGIERNAAGAAYVCSNVFNPTTAATPSVQLLGKIYNACVRNSDAPDLMIMGEDLYSYFDSVVAAQQRWVGSMDLAKVGFPSFKYKSADIVFDEGCPSDVSKSTTNKNEIFCLNTEHFFFKYNTLQPKFERRDYPDRPIKNWMGTHMVQLVSDFLGRLQARHPLVAQPQ